MHQKEHTTKKNGVVPTKRRSSSRRRVASEDNSVHHDQTTAGDPVEFGLDRSTPRRHLVTTESSTSMGAPVLDAHLQPQGPRRGTEGHSDEAEATDFPQRRRKGQLRRSTAQTPDWLEAFHRVTHRASAPCLPRGVPCAPPHYRSDDRTARRPTQIVNATHRLRGRSLKGTHTCRTSPTDAFTPKKHTARQITAK